MFRVVKDVFIVAKEVFTWAFVDEMDAFKVVIKDSDACVTVEAKEVFTTSVKAANRLPRSEMFEVFTVTLSVKVVN